MSDPRKTRVLVTGAGGFVGHHLVRALCARGCWVRGVDLYSPSFELSPATEYLKLDLTSWDDCLTAMEGMDYVFALAANTGPASAAASRDNTLINVHSLEAAREQRVRRFLYASSSLVYPSAARPLTEADADGGDKGLEDLSMERLCHRYRKDFGLETRVARLHNLYGPLADCNASPETSPVSVCAKIAAALPGDVIAIAGDGRQCFSHTFIADGVEGLLRVMRSSFAGPVNIAGSDYVSQNELVDTVVTAAGKPVRKEHNSRSVSAGRRLSTELSRERLLWQPSVGLETGVRQTYRWLERELGMAGRLPRARSAVA